MDDVDIVVCGSGDGRETDLGIGGGDPGIGGGTGNRIGGREGRN